MTTKTKDPIKSFLLNKKAAVFTNAIESMKTYYLTIMNNFENTNGIYEILYIEALLNNICPSGKIDFETYQKISEEICYLDGIVTEFTKSSDEEQLEMLKYMGSAVAQRSKEMNEYFNDVNVAFAQLMIKENQHAAFTKDLNAREENVEAIIMHVKEVMATQDAKVLKLS